MKPVMTAEWSAITFATRWLLSLPLMLCFEFQLGDVASPALDHEFFLVYLGTLCCSLCGYYATISLSLLCERLAFLTYVAIDVGLRCSRQSSTFHRKHGFWKTRKAFPTVFLLLSFASLSSAHLNQYSSLNLHRVSDLRGLSKLDHFSSVTHTNAPFRSWVSTYAQSVAPFIDPDFGVIFEPFSSALL